MKYSIHSLLALILSVSLLGCGKSTDEGHDHDPVDGDDNAALYDGVMKIHDEGMEKMDEIFKLKKQLEDKIKNSPDLVEEKKKSIENTVVQLEEAHRHMMEWMRNWHPENDSLDDEAYREYLESEMEKVKQVKEDIMAAIERAREDAK